MKIDEIRTRLEGIAGFFAARADMAAPGDGKMLMLAWMKAAKEAAALLEEKSVGDLISRPAVMEKMKDLLFEVDSAEYIWSSDVVSAVEHTPAVEAVPVARIREMMTGEDPEESKAAWRVLKALERREKDAGI